MKAKLPFQPHSAPAGLLPAVTAALAAAGLISAAHAQTVQTAGDLFVNVDATSAAEGSITNIPNTGTLGGVFEARAGGVNVPVVELAGGTKGIRFDGNDFMQLVDMAGGTLIPPPAGLVGPDPTRTIEVWAYNDNVLNEETMVSWGKRGGGPDGSNISFNYGNDGRWGAIGHWGNPDIGWNNGGGNPPARQWHHLVYTYDGTTTRVYSDGVLVNSEVLGAGVINTHGGTSIQLAAQLDNNGTTVTAGIRGSLSLGRVRIHDGVLTDAQVQNNFDAEKAAFISPPATPAPATLTRGPVNRYSFNDAPPALAAASSPVPAGTQFRDSVGTAHGRVEGTNGILTGSRLVLPGGAQGTAAYGDLPNGLISRHGAAFEGSGAVTIEAWVKVTGSRAWSRIFDIGSRGPAGGTGSEVRPGDGNPAGVGLDYLAVFAQVNTDTGLRRMEFLNEDPAGGGGVFADAVTPAFNQDVHIAVTWNERTGDIRYYENGFQTCVTRTDDRISALRDLNVWLGRSAYSADAVMQGEFDEFRIYNYVLSPGQVYGNSLAGPNVINTGGSPVTIDQSPSSVTVEESFPVSFAVVTSGSPPITYQWLRNGTPIPGATARTYAIAAAAAGDNGAEFSVEVSNVVGGNPVVVRSSAARLTLAPAPVLKHLYRFNQGSAPAGTAGSGITTVAIDSVGNAHGELRGGASFNGTGRLVLNGSDGYVNLPNNLVLGFQSITIEAWVMDKGSSGWARIFDFGNSGGGEDFPIGGAGSGGLQYMFLSFPSGFGNLRGAYTIGGGGGAEQLIEWPGMRPPRDVLHHIVWVSSAGARTGRLYVNGMLVNENRNVTLTPAALGPTVNNWLGRAQWNDPLFLGEFDQFAIYDGAMSGAGVSALMAAGPDRRDDGPRLSIFRAGAGQVKVCWPKFAAAYFLESATRLGSQPDQTQWSAVDAGTTEEGDFVCVTVPANGNRFYRLSQ